MQVQSFGLGATGFGNKTAARRGRLTVTDCWLLDYRQAHRGRDRRFVIGASSMFVALLSVLDFGLNDRQKVANRAVRVHCCLNV
jgi:hypothetical protein